jgi:hypothetical protein
MIYMLLALAAGAGAWWLWQRLQKLRPDERTRWMRIGGGWAALAIGVVLLLRGQSLIGIPLTMLGSFVLWGRLLPISIRFPGPARPLPGRSDHIRTRHLEAAVDRDTGAVSGTVLAGVFRGRSLERLAPAELAILWRDCRLNDPEAARFLADLLDRRHPSWREDMARAEAETGAGGKMTKQEALNVLGLEPDANEEDVRRAHRELMLKLHPDRGGSNYLAAKVNEAKDVLLAGLAK